MNRSNLVRLMLAVSVLTTHAVESAVSNAPSNFRPPLAAREVAVKGPGHDSSAETDPARLEQSTRLVLDTNAIAAAVAGTNAAPAQAKSFRWQVDWRGWDGVQFEVVRKTQLKSPLRALGWQSESATNEPLSYLHLEQVKLSGTIGGRLEVDAATFATSGTLTGFDPDIELRRLRVTLGGACILVLPVSYYIDLGYNSGAFSLDKSYLIFSAGRFLGNLQIGQFQTPMGLELITSSRDITFMEPAAPLQALAPGVEAGIQIGRPVFNERATWALGIFAPGAGSQDYGIASQDFGSIVGRVTWLPFYHPDPAVPAANRLLHLGVSANVLYASSSTLRYRSRPESYIAPYVIDTGNIGADGAATFGLEAAWVNGPWSVQAEFLRSAIVATNGGENYLFSGCYVNASWYLTGESRPYNPVTGAFNRLIPRHNFSFHGGGWGAFELACGFSYTDLSDGPVAGGKLSLFMAGLNWYLQPHVRWMVNSGVGRASGEAETGNMFILQTRIGIDF